MKKFTNGYLKHLILFTILYTCIFSSLAQNTKAELEINGIMKDLEVIGLSVAVVKNGDIVYTHSFGLKDVESNTALSDQDIFRIASISKSFSATSIMQLIEAKKLKLSDDFSKLVGFKVRNPQFPETIITLKMVLSHTSSINDSEGYFNLDAINPEKNKNWAKCYNNYEPGKGYEYCNLNFNMVGSVIEKYSGERFDNYVKQHILNPLNLNGGYCVDSLDKNKFATIYSYDSKSKKFNASPAAYAPKSEEIKNYTLGYSTPIFSPTGGMKISATDLAKYMSMHMNYGKYNGVRLISKKHSKLMQTKVSNDENYGLALQEDYTLIPGELMIGHIGVAYGLFSAMYFNPQEKFGFVVITNGCQPIYEKDMPVVLNKTINSLYANFIK